MCSNPRDVYILIDQPSKTIQVHNFALQGIFLFWTLHDPQNLRMRYPVEVIVVPQLAQLVRALLHVGSQRSPKDHGSNPGKVDSAFHPLSVGKMRTPI